jgi:antirestriction protein ArdC
MRQANQLGGRVRTGEESTIVVFWKVEDLNQTTEDLDTEVKEEKNRRRFLLRYYRDLNPREGLRRRSNNSDQRQLNLPVVLPQPRMLLPR